MTKSKFWPAAVGVFAAVIFIFGFFRAKDPYRWSGGASADSQSLGGALHFAREGFKAHSFCNYWHPGYLGKSYGAESAVGYYTRYPHGMNMLQALVIRRFGENRTLLMQGTVFIAAAALIFMYLVFAYFFTQRTAFIATVFIGSSLGYLQFIDCLDPYLYSEFFRFAILYVFLLSERFREKFGALALCTLGVWALIFMETFNSLDYIMFPHVFIFFYFLLSPRKMPWGRIVFLGSASVISFGIHLYRGHAVLQQYGIQAGPVLFNFFQEKTLPFHKGFGHVLSFLTYFSRTMETYMVRDNFGLGFGSFFIMMTLILFLRPLETEPRSEGFQKLGFSLPKALTVLAVPSFIWWIIFPNQTASFFNTPMHLYPIAGAVFGLALDACLTALGRKSSSKAFKTAVGFAIAGMVWSPMLITAKYLKEYPNRIDPTLRTYFLAFPGMPGPKLWELLRICQKIRSATEYGDIILTTTVFNLDEPFMEYNADRRMDFVGGTTVSHLTNKISELKKYREEGPKKFKIFNPRLKIYALVQSNECSEIKEYLEKRSSGTPLESGWTLYLCD